jgi:hypothetical protein
VRHLIYFADSPATANCPEDPSSRSLLDGSGIRLHLSAAVEAQDALTALGAQRTLQAATTNVMAWDYAGKRSVAASLPTNHTFGGENARRLESYDPTSAYATEAQADRILELQRSPPRRHDCLCIQRCLDVQYLHGGAPCNTSFVRSIAPHPTARLLGCVESGVGFERRSLHFRQGEGVSSLRIGNPCIPQKADRVSTLLCGVRVNALM